MESEIRVLTTREGLQSHYTWHIIDRDTREIAFHTSDVRPLVVELKRLLVIIERNERRK